MAKGGFRDTTTYGMALTGDHYLPVEWAAQGLPGGQGLLKRLKIRQDQRRPVPQDQRRAERQRVQLLE